MRASLMNALPYFYSSTSADRMPTPVASSLKDVLRSVRSIHDAILAAIELSLGDTITDAVIILCGLVHRDVGSAHIIRRQVCWQLPVAFITRHCRTLKQLRSIKRLTADRTHLFPACTSVTADTALLLVRRPSAVQGML